ncbi:putative secondary metabolism biosynthetic enzyme [Neopestalotiopsis sp. 37M]|nr:putative secondary metabolism biosynthetic enzyme [Neopestalotiopsis sp. 37M]
MAQIATAYGRRLVPRVLDELAETDPNRVYAAVPKSADVKDGFHDVTVADLSRCVDFMASWLDEKFGRSESFETITYIGLSDLRGPTTLLGSIKVGYKLLVPSPRNPASVTLHLMEKTGSTKVLYAAELAPLIKPLQDLAPTFVFDAVPSFQTMLDSHPVRYPYEKSFEQARDEPIVVLHSSGSTGLPKPITITHGSIGAHDNDHNLPVPDGRERSDSTVFTLDGNDRRLYVILPFSHLGGFVFFMDHALLNNLTLVLGPAHVAPDAGLLTQIAQQQKLRGIMVVPAILEQLLHDPKGLDLLKSFEFVACAGAPLPGPVGDQVAKAVKMFIFIGSTETFPLPELKKGPEDWQYHEFNPNLKHEMRPYGDDTFELVILADETTKDSCPVYHNIPGESPFFTKDLFTRHPMKPDLFKYYGRRDDILVFANGEKVNPIPLEQHVQGDPLLKGVLLVGNQRTQSALLVEPRDALDESGRKKLIESLRPRIEEANKLVPGQGRVGKGMVFCAVPDKPFARTGKGTIVRKLTETAYEQEIEHLYSTSSLEQNFVSVDLSGTNVTKSVYERSKIIGFLRQIFKSSFAAALSFGEDEDFFAHGLDSIQTLEITGNLKHNLAKLTSSSIDWISPRTIFQNSTLVALSDVLFDFLNNGTVPETNSETARALAVSETVARHVEKLPQRPTSAIDPKTVQGSSVAIIGSTGYVGSYLLSTLMKDPDVSRVYCLNRNNDAQVRQEKSLSGFGLDYEALSSKVTFLKVELGAPRLGLGQDQWELIANTIDSIVYNSWRLDFEIGIRSFEPFLQATRDLVELSTSSSNRIRIIFVSSTSSVENMALTSVVPEKPVADPLAAMNTGYGQSKLAAEQILVAANRKTGTPVSIVRIGQVGGSSRPDAKTWADQPWISAIIKTSKTLGCFPSPVAPVDWVPVDTVATILQAVALRAAEDEPQVYNIASEPQSWSLLVDLIRQSTDIKEVVSLPGWVDRLRKISDPDLTRLPAVRLLGFYELLGSGTDSLKFTTEHAQTVSGVELKPLKKELLESWLKSWGV